MYHLFISLYVFFSLDWLYAKHNNLLWIEIW